MRLLLILSFLVLSGSYSYAEEVNRNAMYFCDISRVLGISSAAHFDDPEKFDRFHYSCLKAYYFYEAQDFERVSRILDSMLAEASELCQKGSCLPGPAMSATDHDNHYLIIYASDLLSAARAAQVYRPAKP